MWEETEMVTVLRLYQVVALVLMAGNAVILRRRKKAPAGEWKTFAIADWVLFFRRILLFSVLLCPLGGDGGAAAADMGVLGVRYILCRVCAADDPAKDLADTV